MTASGGATIGGWSPRHDGQGWQPRDCSVCGLLITEVLAYNQTAHPGKCKREQQRRYSVRVSEMAKRKRASKKEKALK